MTYRFGFRLLDSARQFITSAVSHAKEDDSSEWKIAVVHLATALELLLKARLAIEDPRLLAATGSNLNEADLESGDFRSVTIEEALRRLRRFGFELAGEQRAALEAVSHLRNRLVHYAVQEDRDRFIAVLVSGLNLFFEVEFSQFRDVESCGSKTQSELITELGKFKAFVQGRLSSLETELASSKRPRTHYFDECSDCLQDTTIITDEGLHCLFCRRTISIRDYAGLASEDGNVEVCPECKRESIVKRQSGDPEPTLECFCCGHLRGPEIRWSDGKKAIPQLHSDRLAY